MPKYPLKPLLEYRERQVDDATSGLGDAVRAREAADRARERAEREKVEAEERAARVRTEEADRLGRGELTVADLARAEAWEFRARTEIGQLTDEATRAEQKASARTDEEAAARAELALKMADRDVVAKDEKRFDAKHKARVMAAEEEAAEEAFQGRGERT